MNAIIRNYDAISALAQRAGHTDLDGVMQYACDLRQALEQNGLLTSEDAGKRMRDVLAKKSVFSVFDALKDSGIIYPTFDDFDTLMGLYVEPIY